MYLYDDKFTIVLNGGNVPIRIEDIPLDDIEADNEDFLGSRMVAPVPPQRKNPNLTPIGNGFGFLVHIEDIGL